MYEADDPRSVMSASGAKQADAAAPRAFGQSTYARFYAEDAQEKSDKASTWYARGQNFVVCYSKVEDGAVFERAGQADEYVLLLHAADLGAVVEAGGERQEVGGYSLTIIPPGDSTVTIKGSGEVVRLISTQNADVVAKVSNPEKYAGVHPHCPPFEPWPEPVGGFKIRNYSLDVADEPGRFGKIFRCTTFMVNVFPSQGARDLTKLSPHHHDDFEQCSLALDGWYMHHLRWPWNANYHDWQADEHEKCAAPSICVIPPRVIHTSAPSEPSANVLVDIFSPPREDFSDQPGWVLNAADYPRK